MQLPLVISLNLFVVFQFLGGICVLLRLLGWIFGRSRSRRARLLPPEVPPPPPNGLSESAPRRLPNFVPPPTPLTDREYWQAEQYCFDHGFARPAPSAEAASFYFSRFPRLESIS